MTQLIERVTVTVTLNHDQVDSAIYCGKTDLKEALKRVWPHICPFAAVSDGTLKMGGLEIKWKSTGLYEETETQGGDN